MITVSSFYHFFEFPNYASWRQPLKEHCIENNIKGTILLAAEGVNATVSGSESAIDGLIDYLVTQIIKEAFPQKRSLCEVHPFGRTKIRLKKEIITFKQPLSLDDKGKHVTVGEWNKLMDDPQVVVIDTRNHYEVALGTFEGAINPHIGYFTELPAFVRANLDPQKHLKIATFCTGGIRCEKFSAWLATQGFKEVYQLEGGILQYLGETSAEENRFRGECFVFDERETVGSTALARH